MEQNSGKLVGLFEGYLKKHKNISGLTLFNEYTKRYFILSMEKFSLVYYKNRKKKGVPATIPLRELLLVQKLGQETLDGETKVTKEWGFEFKVCTRSRTYLINAYSWNDREVWFNAFIALLDYKKKLLNARGLTVNEKKINIDDASKISDRYDLRASDFDTEGTAISIQDALTLYQDEVIKNIEEEERRKIDEEMEEKRIAEENLEKEKEINEQLDKSQLPIHNESSAIESQSQAEGENNEFMSENSFIQKVKEINSGNPKEPQIKQEKSPIKQSSSSEDSDEAHNDIPDMQTLKLKSKSVKTKSKNTVCPPTEDDQNVKEKRKQSVKRNLKVKKKKASKVKEEDDTHNKVQQIQPDAKRFNTIQFDFDDDKLKPNFIFESTEPGVELPMPKPLIEITKDAALLMGPMGPRRVTRFSSNSELDNFANPEGNKPSSRAKKNAMKRRSTMERPSNNQLEEADRSHLLNKWEKQYGNIKDRQFYVKNDFDCNKFSSFNNQENMQDAAIQEDIPEEPMQFYQQPNKIEGSNSHREFEYDWDEEESMSYLKRINADNLKENFNKYGQQNGVPQPEQPKATKSKPSTYRIPNPEREIRKNKQAAGVPPQHHKSVAQTMDDWDE